MTRISKHIQVFKVLFLLLAAGCSQEYSIETVSSEIAFIGDVHFHDIFATFEDGAFRGLSVESEGVQKEAVIRTMEAQLTSTRLFNENYFAFLAALNDVVERNINYVVLHGDFSDDGQPLHLRGFRDILDHYEENYGIRFFLAPGNHDPVRPFNLEAGKRNFLGDGGMEQAIFSHGHPLCEQMKTDRVETETSNQLICSDEVVELGYRDLFQFISIYGFIPRESDLYFETPFSTYNYSSYTYETALREAGYENRLYEICHEGSGGIYKEEHYTRCFDIMDMSYLIEPEEGLWILSMDSNVYIPRATSDPDQPENPANFYGTGNAGFNAVLTHKKHLLDWVSDVHHRADSLGKQVITFSHYPASDFYNGAASMIEALWGENRFQLARLPSVETTRTLSRHGIKVHVGAHMHMNDTSLFEDEETGRHLLNIQVPSIAAYVPAYKILRKERNKPNIEVQTVILDEVEGFDTLFPLYETEWEMLNHSEVTNLWNRGILDSKSYREFTNWHMRELSRLRFLPGEWPSDLRYLLSSLDGYELFFLLHLESRLSETDQVLSYENMDQSGKTGGELLKRILKSTAIEWKEFNREAISLTKQASLTEEKLREWDGRDLSVDFYRLRNAGSLAHRDIPSERLMQYKFLAGSVTNNQKVYKPEELSSAGRLGLVFQTMMRFNSGLPDDHFRVNLESGEIEQVRMP